jgi:hypothetical protein
MQYRIYFQVLELEPENVEAQAMSKILRKSTQSAGPTELPPHAHKGPLPIVLLSTDQKWLIPASITKRAYV